MCSGLSSEAITGLFFLTYPFLLGFTICWHVVVHSSFRILFISVVLVVIALLLIFIFEFSLFVLNLANDSSIFVEVF